jgi:HK97 gp10 family phage protein
MTTKAKAPKWTGVDEALRAVKGLGEIAAPQVIEAALLQLGWPIAAEMSAKVPRRTGRTAEDIRAAIVRDGGNPEEVRMDIGARGGKKGRAFILRWIEFGTAHTPARHPMRTVWEGHRERFASDFTKALRPAYERIVKQLARFAKKRGLQ